MCGMQDLKQTHLKKSFHILFVLVVVMGNAVEDLPQLECPHSPRGSSFVQIDVRGMTSASPFLDAPWSGNDAEVLSENHPWSDNDAVVLSENHIWSDKDAVISSGNHQWSDKVAAVLSRRKKAAKAPGSDNDTWVLSGRRKGGKNPWSDNDVVVLSGNHHDNGKAWTSKVSPSAGKQTFMRYRRPEWQKTLRCSNSSDASCVECWQARNCWAPWGDIPGRYLHPSRRLRVDPSTMWTRFLNIVHVKCNGEELIIKRKLMRMQGGVLQFFWDGKELVEANGFRVHSLMSPVTDHDVSGWKRYKSNKKYIKRQRDATAYAIVHLSESGGHEFLSEFTVRDDDSPPHAVDLTMHLFMARDFRQCQESKACLAVFESTSWYARRLRNSNTMQVECLQAPMSDTTNTCAKWRSCLQQAGDHQEERLLTLLHAAGVGQVGPMPIPETPGSHCINPLIEDPESWQCDCFDEMLQRCERMVGVAGYTKTRCLQAQWCDHDFVCDFWKKSICSDSSMDILRSALKNSSSLLQHHDRDFSILRGHNLLREGLDKSEQEEQGTDNNSRLFGRSKANMAVEEARIESMDILDESVSVKNCA